MGIKYRDSPKTEYFEQMMDLLDDVFNIILIF
jgi:hypothetical protein